MMPHIELLGIGGVVVLENCLFMQLVTTCWLVHQYGKRRAAPAHANTLSLLDFAKKEESVGPVSEVEMLGTEGFLGMRMSASGGEISEITCVWSSSNWRVKAAFEFSLVTFDDCNESWTTGPSLASIRDTRS